MKKRITSKRHRFLEADQQSYWTEQEPQGDSTTTNRFDSAHQTDVVPDQMRHKIPEAKAEASTVRPPSVSYWRDRCHGGSVPKKPSLNQLDNSSIG